MRLAFQGELGAFSEEAAVRLIGEGISAVPRATFDAAFAAITDGAADALLVPVENSLAGSVVRVYDLLLESDLVIVAETILPIEHHLIGCPGAAVIAIRSVASHPMALAQCERFFAALPHVKRIPAEDTAGSVREVLARGDNTCAAIAGRRAAARYAGAILASNIQDNPENFTRFFLLQPANGNACAEIPGADKMTIAMRLAHRPGSLVAALAVLFHQGVNLLKIESRPIHGSPWEYQFFLDVESEAPQRLEQAVSDLRSAAQNVRVLGFYPGARVQERDSSAAKSAVSPGRTL